MAKGCATPRLFLERTFAKLPPTLGSVYFAALIPCDKLPVRFEKQSPKSTLSVALVFFSRSLVLRGTSSCRDVQPTIRIAPNHGTTLGLLRADPAVTHCRECLLVVHGRVERASFQPTSMQLSQLSRSCAGFRPLIPIPSLHTATPGSASVVFGAPFSSGAPLVRLADKNPSVI